MQALSVDYDIKAFEPSVQRFAPMIEHLSANERFALIKLIMDMPFTDGLSTEKISANSNIAEKRFNRFPIAMTMSDNFDEYLGDNFWFPEDDILYK